MGFGTGIELKGAGAGASDYFVGLGELSEKILLTVEKGSYRII